MEQNAEDTTVQAEAVAEKPVRRRASRRVSTAAVTPTSEAAPVEAAAPAAEAAPAAAAPAAEAAPAEAAAEAPAEAPKKRATRSRKKPVEATEAAAEAAPAAATEAPAAAAAEEAPAEAPKRGRRRAQSAAAAPEAAAEAQAEEAPAAAAAEEPAAEAAAAPKRNARGNAAKAAAEAAEPAAAEGAAAEAESGEATQAETGRGRGRNRRGQKAEANAAATDAAPEAEKSEKGDKSEGEQGNREQRDNNQRGGENNARSSRTRQRDRKRRGQGDEFEPEIAEDDVLLPIAGILDVLDNYAFVRTSGYLPGTSDVYVSLGQVKKYGLRRGDAVVGAIRQPRDGDANGRQKYNAIVKIDSVNGRTLEENEKRIDLSDLTAIFPQERLRLETGAEALFGRAADLVAPIGLGQRGLIVTPTGVQNTRVIGEIAAAVSANKPDAHLIVVLTHAQPEEVTRLERSVRGEVVAATFDRAAEDQTTVAELAIDRARRLVELGHDVVVLVDSLNRLARGYAQTQPANVRPARDVIDEHAFSQVAALLSAARNLENGGSLTLLATVQTKTGVDADKQLLREVLPAANAVIRLTARGYGRSPQVDLENSYTIGAEDMVSADEAGVLAQLQTALAVNDDAAGVLDAKLRATGSNAALLAEVQRAGGLS